MQRFKLGTTWRGERAKYASSLKRFLGGLILQYCAKEMKAKFAEICEFRRTNYELSFQKKKRRNFGASIVLTSAKFRKQCEESKRNFVPAGRKSVSLTGEAKFRLQIRVIYCICTV